MSYQLVILALVVLGMYANETRAALAAAAYLFLAADWPRTQKAEGRHLDIYAQGGTQVVFNHPNAGWPWDQKVAAHHLVVGATYTVERTIVHSSRTEVYLVEVPGVVFNSVLFDDK
jgi:hypothetical protein